jgi:HEAT repeat protein
VDIRNIFKPNIRKMKANRDVDGLTGALRYEKDWKIRVRAVDSVGELKDKRAVEPLIETLKDENQHVQSASIAALGKIGDGRAVEPLINVMRNRHLREIAAFALGELGDEKAVQPLLQILNDEDEYVRETASEALGKIGELAVDPLVQALKKEDCYIREGAALALGQTGDKRALNPLI